jgi:hypothetical protein
MRTPPIDHLQVEMTTEDLSECWARAAGRRPPEDLLAGLLADPETRAEAAAHLTDPDRVATLVGDDDPGVWEAAAGDHGVPFGLVRALAQDRRGVRVAIMLWPDTPDEIRDVVTATVEPQDYHPNAERFRRGGTPPRRGGHR